MAGWPSWLLHADNRREERKATNAMPMTMFDGPSGAPAAVLGETSDSTNDVMELAPMKPPAAARGPNPR